MEAGVRLGDALKKITWIGRSCAILDDDADKVVQSYIRNSNVLCYRVLGVTGHF